MKQITNVLMKSKSDKIKQEKAMELLEENQRLTTTRKRKKCSDECICKRIAVLNKKQLDPLLFDIKTVNSKKYMDDYMNALGLSHQNESNIIHL